jgi:DeoR family glycerol-3-phosphate regulon repressor
MNPTDRQTEIVNIIRQRNRVAVDELAKKLQISKETIRRDLTELAKTGKVQKFHGGASMPMMTGEGPFCDRMSDNAPAKASIATEAIKLISPGETVLIDTGSTTVYFAEKLAELFNLTVVTNSAEIAKVISLAPTKNKTFLLGGEFNADNRQTVGSMAVSQIRSFRAHHAVLTIGALDLRTGIMDFCIEEAQVARAMIEQSESVTILADNSKFGKIASFEVCSLDKITNLVCDQTLLTNYQDALTEAGVNVCIVE